jgi:acyl-CoA synthetase (NDP forming)/GNAT superfamily N-acetyltransferase
MTISGGVLLRDGTMGIIREVTLADHDLLLALHEGVSPRTLYLRFFSASRLSPRRYVERLLRPESDTHAGVVLETEGRLVGVAAYERLGDSSETASSAEAAMLVADDQHGRGIGTLLLEHLATLARSRGIHQFIAETLHENAAMLDVFREVGYDVSFRGSLDVVDVCINLAPGTNLLTAQDRRETLATRASLLSLMKPRSVAIVGASEKAHTVGTAVLKNVVEAGFTGPVYPVNSRFASQEGPHFLQGVTSFSRLSDLPGPVDLVVVAVPAAAVLGLVDECAAVGARTMVVVSAGFADAGPEGVLLQKNLQEKARRAGIRLVGPNCLGLISRTPNGMLAASFAPTLPVPGRVGILSQSGGLGIALLEHTREAGIGLSSLVSVGNKADVSGNDLLSWWDEDPQTDIAVLYLESFGNPRKFARLARHLAARKPVVAIKSGMSVIGARAAQSHTAAAATPAKTVAALFKQAGVINVQHVGELVDVLTLLSTQPLPSGPRLAIIGNAGGPGILAADAAAEYGLEVPVLSDATQSLLRSQLPAGAATANPVDTIASANGIQFKAAVSVLLDAPEIDALLAVITPTPLTEPSELVAALRDAGAGSTKPVVVTRIGADTVTNVLASPDGAAIPSYAFPETAVHALSRAAEYRAFLDRPTGRVPHFPDIDRNAARSVMSDALQAREDGWLDPQSTDRLLSAYGISTVASRVVTSAEDAAEAAIELGFPVVVKAVGPGLVHKTDIGGVQLNVTSSEGVRMVYQAMKRSIGAQMNAALIQPMAPAGIETIVGVTSDPAFGPLVMFGLGGIWADLLADQAFRLVPLTDVDAVELIEGLRTTPLLHGYRGTPACDVEAIKDLLLRVAQLADDNPELTELDLNPVVATSNGVLVLDAKVRVAAVVSSERH